MTTVTLQPTAIIFVDGDEYIRCFEGDDHKALFEQTPDKVREFHPGQHEYALSVWRPRSGAYLRERLLIA